MVLRHAALPMCAMLAAFSAGCTRGATQLVVVVESDLASSQRRCVLIETGPVVPGEPFEVTSGWTFYIEDNGAPEVTIPFSAGVTPPGGDPRARVEIRVSALSVCADPAPPEARTVTRTARTGFLPEQTLILPIFLQQSCVGMTCPAELTCIDGVCADPDVDPATLRRSGGDGDEFVDGGRRDVGPGDAGRGDAGPCSESPCRITPPQCGCGPTEGCYYPVSAPICLPAGPGREGDLCAMENDCAAGLGCRNDTNLTPAVGSECVGVCANAGDCASNVCVSLGVGFGVCMTACDPITNTGCGSRDCRIADYLGTRLLTVCSRPLGAAAAGAACSGPTSCGPGLTCDRAVCRQLCNRTTGAGCAGGSTCMAPASAITAGATSYGVCMP